MSTYIYLECLDHDPPMTSDGEVGQHTYDLPDVRKMIANRETIVKMMSLDLPFQWDSHFDSNTAYFLAAHPTCRLRIYDEYGGEYDIEEGSSEKPRNRPRP